MINPFEVPVEELSHLPVSQARARLGMPPEGDGEYLYGVIELPAPPAAALRREWKALGHRR